MDKIKWKISKIIKDYDDIIKDYFIVGKSGVRHKIDYLLKKGDKRIPIKINNEKDVIIDISILRIICKDIGLNGGILLIPRNVEISKEIRRMAKECKIRLIIY